MPIFNLQFAGATKTPDGKNVPIPPHIALFQGGPLVPVMVCLEVNMAKPLLSQGKSIVSQGGMALIDTGANVSSIDEETAKQMGLPIVDQGKMSSASHEMHPCNFYPIQITLGGRLTFQVPRAMGANLKSKNLIALIGRDILQRCTLIYNGGTGTITLAI
jgi:predicted aspartyl protease